MRGYRFRYVPVVLLAVASLGGWGAASGLGDEPRAAGYLYPARDVGPAVLKSDGRVVVSETADCWSFAPAETSAATALLFFPGGGVEPTAYAPLARAIAAEGWPVLLVKSPARLASPDQSRKDGVDRGQAVVKAHPAVKRWVVGGHSLGGSIAARFVHDQPKRFRGLVLIGTTHPRDFDISEFPGDVTKVYGTEDRVARQEKSEANKKLLPKGTAWVRVEGGNHAQFGHFGPMPGDGKATISRDEQQRSTREAIVRALQRASESPR